MALTENPKVWKIVTSVFILMTLFFGILFYFQEIFLVFLVAIVLVFTTSKFLKLFLWITDHIHLPRLFKNVIGTIFILGILGVVYWVGHSAILGLSGAFKNHETLSLNSYYLLLKEIVPENLGRQFITLENIAIAQTYVFDLLSGFVSAIPGFLMMAVLIIPLVFYMYFKKRKKLIDDFIDLVPARFHSATKKAITRISLQMKEFTSAKFYESFVVATICVVGFYISGIEGWLFLGILAGVLNIVPYVGPAVGAIPPLLVGLLNSPTQALYVLITISVAQLIDNLYIIPFFISKSVRVEPIISLILILVGARLFGALGMILAIPIYLIYKIVLEEVYIEVLKVYEKSEKEEQKVILNE